MSQGPPPDLEGATRWRMYDLKTGRRSPHLFAGPGRRDGACWCVVCERWETLYGKPFEGPQGGATIAATQQQPPGDDDASLA